MSSKRLLFCQTIHGGVAGQYLGNADWSLIKAVKCAYPNDPISTRLLARLAIAGSVQRGGNYVTAEQVEVALHEGATNKNSLSAVLIATAFCRFNRCVDGLSTRAPDAPDRYRYRATKVAESGYTSDDHYMPG